MSTLRRVATTVAALLTLTFVTPATAQRRPQLTRADWQAIAQLANAWQRWITALTVTPYTGPECPGRWAIPTSIVWRESRCQFNVRNPSSSAGGAYQMISSSRDWALRQAGLGSWAGTPAEQLPAWVQHAAAHQLWSNSHCHWAPNPWCG